MERNFADNVTRSSVLRFRASPPGNRSSIPFIASFDTYLVQPIPRLRKLERSPMNSSRSSLTRHENASTRSLDIDSILDSLDRLYRGVYREAFLARPPRCAPRMHDVSSDTIEQDRKKLAPLLRVPASLSGRRKKREREREREREMHDCRMHESSSGGHP